MNKKYISPIIDIIKLDLNDIVTASEGFTESTNDCSGAESSNG